MHGLQAGEALCTDGPCLHVFQHEFVYVVCFMSQLCPFDFPHGIQCYKYGESGYLGNSCPLMQYRIKADQGHTHRLYMDPYGGQQWPSKWVRNFNVGNSWNLSLYQNHPIFHSALGYRPREYHCLIFLLFSEESPISWESVLQATFGTIPWRTLEKGVIHSIGELLVPIIYILLCPFQKLDRLHGMILNAWRSVLPAISSLEAFVQPVWPFLHTYYFSIADTL